MEVFRAGRIAPFATEAILSRGPFEHNAEIIKLVVDPPVPQMNVHVSISVRVAFGDNAGLGERVLVLPSVQAFFADVDALIEKFRRFFPDR